MEITALTALELGKKIKAGEVTVEEAVKAQLEKIKERDSVYNCYVTVMEEEALKRAAEVQKQIHRWPVYLWQSRIIFAQKVS